MSSAQEVTETLARGRKNKAVAATEANIESSRSHVIVRVLVSATNLITKATTVGRLNLVDLAGSERVSQTNATGQLLKEAQAINKSLSELGNVVLALRQNQKHIPFRNCQLTRILEDSLSELEVGDGMVKSFSDGDSKTLVIVHLSPDAKSLNESISSVNFAEKIGQVGCSHLYWKRSLCSGVHKERNDEERADSSEYNRSDEWPAKRNPRFASEISSSTDLNVINNLIFIFQIPAFSFLLVHENPKWVDIF